LTVLLDADFLSAFLKIEQLALVREFYRVDRLVTPPAVYREVSRTDLLQGLAASDWIQVRSPESAKLAELLRDEDIQRLGPGEQEVLALALEVPEAVVLMNDNQARRRALDLGVTAVNIPAFLLACKHSGLVDRVAVAHLVDLLRERDHYGFRRDILDLLLS
jgi:predicted nucleic acid-binding protein